MNSDQQAILKGKTIVCTYPENEQDEAAERLRKAGALVLSMPMITVEPIPFRLKNDPQHYDWLVFTSKNAVSSFFSRYSLTDNQNVAALGPGTAAELTKQNCRVNFTGKGKSAVHFAREIRQIISPGEKILLVLGTLAPDRLEKTLSENYAIERINVYLTTMPAYVDTELVQRVENDLYDVLLVSSPSAFFNLFSILQGNKENLRIISIGETTTAAIRKFNIEPVATALNPGYKGLAEAAVNYFKNYKNHIS